MSNSTEIIKAAAICFAKQGYQVFPKYEGKLPHNFLHNKGEISGYIEGRFHCPSTVDEAAIQNWPLDMYGYELTGYGVHPYKRAVIIDVDVKNGHKGLQSLEALKAKYGLDLDTFVVQSPSGGYHYYFEYPDHIKNDMSCYVSSPVEVKIPDMDTIITYDGIDVRSDTAHVTGPLPHKQFYKGQNEGSVGLIKDGLYTIVSGGMNKLTKLPLELVKHWIRQANKELTQVQANDIPIGVRNDYIFKQIICRYKSKNLPLWQAHAAIKEIYPQLEQGSDNISLDSLLERATQIYEDNAYSTNNYQNSLDEFLQNLIFIGASNEVYDMRTGLTIPKNNAETYYKKICMIENVEKGSIKAVDIFKKWVESPDRMDVAFKIYWPGQEQIMTSSEYTGAPVRVLNTYAAPAGIYGDLLPYKDAAESKYVQDFLALTDFVCEDKAKYFLQFAAHLVQHPGKKIQHMLMIASETQGIGKDTWFRCISAAIGQRNARVIELSGFEDKFNSHLFDAQLILINEGDTRYSKERNAVYNKLKVHLTADKLDVRAMRQDYVTQRLFSNYMWFANNIDAIGIDEGDSRIYPHISGKMQRLPENLAVSIYDALEHRAFGAALHTFLKEYPITDFKYYDRAPATEDKRRLIEANMDSCKRDAIECVQTQTEFFCTGILHKDLLVVWLSKRFGGAQSPQQVDRTATSIVKLLLASFNLHQRRTSLPRFSNSYGRGTFRILDGDRPVSIYMTNRVRTVEPSKSMIIDMLERTAKVISPLDAPFIEAEFKLLKKYKP